MVTPTQPSRLLAARLKVARNDAGISQVELAGRLNVSQGAISAWESGTRQPNLDDLYSLAGELGVAVHDLLPRNAGVPVRAALRAVAENLDSEELASALDDFVDFAESKDRPDQELTLRFDDAVDAAESLLRELQLTMAPIDVIDVARRCGVPVIDWPFEVDLSGIVVETADGPVIGIEESESNKRKRFTIGHELGHILLTHLDSFHIDLNPASESGHGNAPGYNWRHERAANEFSAALIMPERLVKEAFAEGLSVEDLSELFDVSKIAMSYRLKNLKLK